VCSSDLTVGICNCTLGDYLRKEGIMPLIKILAGNYGLRVGNRVVLKNAKSDPFKVTTEQAKRLVDLGAGEIIADGTEDSPDAGTSYASLGYEEVKALLDERGVAYKRNGKKDDLVALLEEGDGTEGDGTEDDGTEDDGTEGDGTEDAPPAPSVAEPVV
jgi:hypothetical protein